MYRLLLLISACALTAFAQTESAPPAPKTTQVVVILTARAQVSRQQIMKVMPAEVTATVKLYLDGKIQQWYSRGDGRGVIFFLDARSVDDARALMNSLPLAKENLMDYEYIPVGPLMPLAALVNGAKP